MGTTLVQRLAMASASCQETIAVATPSLSSESQAVSMNGDGSPSCKGDGHTDGRVDANMHAELKARGMELRDILPPRPTTIVDALIVFVVHMLPFTPVPVAVTVAAFILLKR